MKAKALKGLKYKEKEQSKIRLLQSGWLKIVRLKVQKFFRPSKRLLKAKKKGLKGCKWP